MNIDSLNFAAGFFSGMNVSKDVPKSADKSKSEKVKSSFISMFQKSQQIQELVSMGLPQEIADMEIEDAFNFLKDNIETNADKLEENFSMENFANFKKSVSQFLKYLEKNNYEVKTKNRIKKEFSHKGPFNSPFFEEKKKLDPWVQVRVVNERLDQLSREVLDIHSNKLKLLSKVGEIKGLIVDFFSD